MRNAAAGRSCFPSTPTRARSATRRSDGAFRSHAPVPSQSRDTLALQFWFAGRHDEAVQLWTRVRDDSRETLGGAHPQTLRTMRLLMNAGFLRGDPATGLQRARELLAEPPMGVPEFDRGGEEQRVKAYGMLAEQKVEDADAWRDLALAILTVRPDDRGGWGVLGRALEAAGESESAVLFGKVAKGEAIGGDRAAVAAGVLEELLDGAPGALEWLKGFP